MQRTVQTKSQLFEILIKCDFSLSKKNRISAFVSAEFRCTKVRRRIWLSARDSRCLELPGTVWNSLRMEFTTSQSQSLLTVCQHLKTRIFRNTSADLII